MMCVEMKLLNIRHCGFTHECFKTTDYIYICICKGLMLQKLFYPFVDLFRYLWPKS